jgi:uncharacterized protein YjdB
VTAVPEELDAPESLTLYINGEDQALLDIAVLPENATQVDLEYESSDETIATVDEAGVVTAVGNGECTVTVTAPEYDLSAEIKVTVVTMPTEIGLSETEGTLTVGKSSTVKVYALPEEAQKLEADKVTYKSSDTKVATVTGTTEGDAGFTVSGVSAGNATITIQYEDLEVEYDVTVKAATSTTTKTSSGTTNKTSTGTGSTTTSSSGSVTTTAPAQTTTTAPTTTTTPTESTPAASTPTTTTTPSNTPTVTNPGSDENQYIWSSGGVYDHNGEGTPEIEVIPPEPERP